MEIRHERPMPDLAFQVAAPLGLELPGGRRVTIQRWSLAGFEYPEETDILPKRGVLTIPFQGIDLSFPVDLEQDQMNGLVKFLGLTGRQRETLAIFYRSILSGRMATTEEVITSLDTPVDLVPMGETETEKKVATKDARPRILRVIWNAVFYAVAAVIVFGLIGAQIWDRLSSIRLENVRIVAPTETYRAAGTAYVEAILARPGDRVRAGDVIVRLGDPDDGATLAALRDDIARAERRLAEAGASGGGEALAAERRADLARLKRALGIAKRNARALDIVAAADGTIDEIHVRDDQFVSRDAPVATIERAEPRHAVGWLPESAAMSAFPGQAARLTVTGPDGTRVVDGVVADIAAGADTAGNRAFGALVTVTAPGLTLDEARAAFRPGAPARIALTRSWFGFGR